MGHASTENISRTMNRLLHAKGKVTVKEVVAELVRTKQVVHAGEGPLNEPWELAIAVEQLVAVLYNDEAIGVCSLTREQRPIFRAWRDEEASLSDWDSGDDGDGGQYGIFDSIRWRPLKKRLPVIRYIES